MEKKYIGINVNATSRGIFHFRRTAAIFTSEKFNLM